MAAPRKRLPEFDLLRGVAILYIVGIRHMDGYAGDIYHCKLDDILAYSLLGLFVFISGYLLQRGMPIIRSGGQLRTFLLRRFLRIYPLYLLALMAFRVCGFITPAELLQQIFLLNIFLNSSVITLWFVSMLCVFYLLYPLLVRFRSPAATLLTTAGLCAIGLGANIAFDLVDFRALIFLPLFTLGILASRHGLLFAAFRSTPFCIASSLLCLVASVFYFMTPRASSLFMLLFHDHIAAGLVPDRTPARATHPRSRLRHRRLCLLRDVSLSPPPLHHHDAPLPTARHYSHATLPHPTRTAPPCGHGLRCAETL